MVKASGSLREKSCRSRLSRQASGKIYHSKNGFKDGNFVLRKLPSFKSYFSKLAQKKNISKAFVKYNGIKKLHFHTENTKGIIQVLLPLFPLIRKNQSEQHLKTLFVEHLIMNDRYK